MCRTPEAFARTLFIASGVEIEICTELNLKSQTPGMACALSTDLKVLSSRPYTFLAWLAKSVNLGRLLASGWKG
jgi:hypothetical protein